MLVVSSSLCTIIYAIGYCFLFCRYTKQYNFKIDIKMIILSFISVIIYHFANEYGIKNDLIWLRPFLVQLSFLLILFIYYKNNFVKTLMTTLCIFLTLCFAELIFSFIMAFFFKYVGPNFVDVWYGYLFSNTIICLICVSLSYIRFIKIFFSNIITWCGKNEYKILILYFFMCMVVFIFLLYNNYKNAFSGSFLLFLNIFCIAVIFFIINYFKEKADNNRIIFEYDQLLDYVKRYERVIEAKSKNQHEYKNQLVMIKSLVSKNNTKAIKYIESLYNEETDDKNVDLLKKLKYLPKGGLKGLIYYKMDEMEDKKINYFVEISPEVKNVTFNKKIDKNLKDISKILGVYIDNAIEASFNSKEKYLILEVYIDNNDLMFSISNTYSGIIDLNKIDKEGYTTKGNGKGYGLSLVKDLISQNKYLEQERSMNGIYYTQKLRIKK